MEGNEFKTFTKEAVKFQDSKSLQKGDDVYYAYAKFSLSTEKSAAGNMVKLLKDILKANEELLGNIPGVIEPQ